MIVNTEDDSMPVFVTNEVFARQQNENTWYSKEYKGWYLQDIK